ncbi:MAG: SDR family oxidoreductase [Pseudomonadales bacterium]|nr:SDR family oxidoreductase [Pseudomonadales bacterium]
MLLNKTIVITGAASGLGNAWAKGFLAEGAAVVAADIDADGLKELQAQGARTYVADVSAEQQVKDLIQFAVSETGRLDVLFNNAGFGNNKPFLDIPEGDFERHLAVHVNGALYGMRYAIPVMLQQGGGRIINTLSRAAEISGPRNAAYAAAKAALWSLSHSVAAELGSETLLINMLIPGPTNTAIWGRDMPQMQTAEVTYPTARMMATMADGGGSGKVYWDEQEYPLFRSLYREEVAD